MTASQSNETPDAASNDAQNYRFSFEPETRRVIAQFKGHTLADSRRAMRLEETRIAPVCYFPREDVRMELFEPSGYVTYCPFKGNAAHYSLRVDEITADNLLWSYEDPFKDAAHIRDYVAFYPDQVDITYPEDETTEPAETEATPVYENPLVSWVLQEAPAIATSRELTAAFARQLRSAGVPVWRLAIIIRTLHPQVVAFVEHWHSVSGELVAFDFDHEGLQRSEFLNSPLVPIFEGAGGIRRRLDIDNPVLDFGVLKDLHAEQQSRL